MSVFHPVPSRPDIDVELDLLTPMAAIGWKCMDCAAGQRGEVLDCVVEDCALHKFRKRGLAARHKAWSNKPARPDREMPQGAIEALAKWRARKAAGELDEDEPEDEGEEDNPKKGAVDFATMVGEEDE